MGEYTLAYCGAQAWQGDPMEWVSTHRYHHLHCETPLDPHTIYEGFWWSHIGWLMDWKVTERRTGDQTNAKEMQDQPFYTHMQKHYSWHVAGPALRPGRAPRPRLGGLRAHLLGVARHLVRQLRVPRLGEPGLCHRGPLPEQLVGRPPRLRRGLAQQPPRL